MVAYDYSKLLGRITEKMGTQAKFANAMNMSERTCSLKLNGKIPFKQTEIVQACAVLEIADSEIPSYFFTLKVQSN